MQYVVGACSISCFSFMPFWMLIVLTLNRSSYAKHSILLKDRRTFLDEEGIGLQMEFTGHGPPVTHHNILEMEVLHPTFSCCMACVRLPAIGRIYKATRRKYCKFGD